MPYFVVFNPKKEIKFQVELTSCLDSWSSSLVKTLPSITTHAIKPGDSHHIKNWFTTVVGKNQVL